MSYQSDSVATGPRRDLGDAMALTKSRLALDVMTASDLHGIVDKLTAFSGKQPTTADLKPVHAALSALRDHHYGDNEVKKGHGYGLYPVWRAGGGLRCGENLHSRV
ncbi:AvrE-family type 3 secretion system effector [Dickeya oryzae]